MFSTARKATAGGVIAVLSPLYVLVQSEMPITGRAVLACVLAGLIGWLGVYAPANDDPPKHL